MSGVEVAGLLLGAFPLLISALEQYRQGAEVLEDWWQIKREYKKCENEIKVQELAFENNVERFLLPLVADDDDIAVLIAQPGGSSWKDAALEAKLKERLPKSYELFLATIEDIKLTIDGLKDELGVSREAFQKVLEAKKKVVKTQSKQITEPRTGLRRLLQRKKHASTVPQKLIEPPPASDVVKPEMGFLSRPNVFIEYQAQRMKFALGKTNRTKLFDEFARYNARLRELLDTSDQSTIIKQSREHLKKSLIRKVVWKLWRHAASLHDLLDHAWRCKCKYLHRVHLLLHHISDVQRIEFDLFFVFGTKNATDSSPWKCQTLSAQHVKPEENTTFVVPKGRAPSSSSAPKTPKSSLRDPNASSGSSHAKVNWPNVPDLLAQEGTERNVITDLCSTVAACQKSSTCLGLLEGEEEAYSLHQGGGKLPSNTIVDTVSLDTLLSKASQHRLDRRQRYTIAYTLASSHLQLYPSPWLYTHWSKRDIVFARDPYHPTSIHFHQPYILKDLSTPHPISLPSSEYVSSDRSLQTLGILLIELCFGTALEDHPMRQQFHSSGTLADPSTALALAASLDMAVAMEWAGAVEGEAGDGYADAVQWCLRGQVAGEGMEKWREKLFEHVVTPLQVCYEQINPGGRKI